MNFPFRNLHSKTATPKLTTFNINNLLIDKRRSEYIKGFYTARHLQCTLKDGSIPYSLAHSNIKNLSSSKKEFKKILFS